MSAPQLTAAEDWIRAHIDVAGAIETAAQVLGHDQDRAGTALGAATPAADMISLCETF